MTKKIYILQAGFLPIGETDVTGWRAPIRSTLARDPTTTPWPPTAAR